jgi:hypothetical protein
VTSIEPNQQSVDKSKSIIEQKNFGPQLFFIILEIKTLLNEKKYSNIDILKSKIKIFIK